MAQLLKVHIINTSPGRVTVLALMKAADGKFVVANASDIFASSVAACIEQFVQDADSPLLEAGAVTGEVPF